MTDRDEAEDFLSTFSHYVDEIDQSEIKEGKRSVCDDCKRPATVCWCPFLPQEPLHVSTHIYILQHPFEESRRLRTVPMLVKSLGQDWVTVLRGKRFSQKKYPELAEVLKHPSTLLLYPGPDAIDLSHLVQLHHQPVRFDCNQAADESEPFNCDQCENIEANSVLCSSTCVCPSKHRSNVDTVGKSSKSCLCLRDLDSGLNARCCSPTLVTKYDLLDKLNSVGDYCIHEESSSELSPNTCKTERYCLRADQAPLKSMDRSRRQQSYNLVILDGTWAQAKGLYCQNEMIRWPRKVQIHHGEKSKYVIRTQPTDGALSTLESAAVALSILENRPEIVEILTRPLVALCEFQIAHGAVKHHSREYKVEHGLWTKPLPRSVRKRLEQCRPDH